MKRITTTVGTRGTLKLFALALAAGAAAVALLACLPAQAQTTTTNITLSSQALQSAPPGSNLLPQIPQGTLPPGSILRSITVSMSIDASGCGDSWLSDFLVYFDSNPADPGTVALLQFGGNYDGPVGTVREFVGWTGADHTLPFTLTNTINFGTGWNQTVDLHNVQVSVGDNYCDSTFTGTVTIEYDLVPPAVIVSFGPGAVVDQNLKTISWTVPYGTDLMNLTPTIIVSSGDCVPASGASPVLDVNKQATYTITDAGVATNVYTLTVTVIASDETTLIWNTGSGAWDLVATNWIGQVHGLPLPFWNGVNVIFNDTGSGGTVSVAPDMSPASTTVSNRDYTFTGGPIAGTGPLTKAGSGTLTLAGANTYSGDTAVNGGTLVANGNSAVAGTTNFTVAGGANLLLTGASGAYKWPAKAATLTGAGTVSIPLGGGINSGLNFDMGTFTGILDLTNGMVAVLPAYSPSFVSPTNGTIRVEDHTTVYLGWTGFRLNTTVELEGGHDNGEGFGVLRGDNATLDGAVILKTNSVFGCAGGTFTINAAISDGGHGYGFSTVKDGTFILTATNTYSGPTIVSSGTVVLAGANTGSGPMIVTNGTLVCSNANSLSSGALIINNPGVVNLTYSGDHVVSSLYFDGMAQGPGTYGSLSSTAPLLNQNDIWFVGTGVGTVTVAPEPVNIRVLSGQPNIDVFGTAVGSTYTLVYKNNLTDVSWTPLSAPSGSQAGVNGTLTLIDTTATGQSQRFYKIHASTP